MADKFFTGYDNLHKSFFLLLVIILLNFVWLIPHGQSPDEMNHLYRAYSFSRGHVLLPSGGISVDAGLKNYLDVMSMIPLHYKNKAVGEAFSKAKKIKFSHEKVHVLIPNTAMYFPLSYLPQSLALTIGKLTKMKVHQAITLARIFNIFTIFIMLLVAFKIYSPPLPIYILLLMPISLFQMGSTTTDGLHFAMTILIMSLIFSLYSAGYSRKKLFLLCFLIFTIATHRINLSPLVLTPFILFFHERRKIYPIASIILILLILLWIFFVMINLRGVSSQSMLTIFLYYLTHPADLINIFINTFTDKWLLQFYRNSFVGTLGWLDYKVPKKLIDITYVVLLFSVIVSLTRKLEKINIMVMLLCLLPLFLTWLILLVQWNPFPCTDYIKGVQGRYLIPISIVFLYALCSNETGRVSILKHIKFILVISFGIISYIATNIATIHRYFG